MCGARVCSREHRGEPSLGIIDTGSDIFIMGGDLFKKVASAKKKDFRQPVKSPVAHGSCPASSVLCAAPSLKFHCTSKSYSSLRYHVLESCKLDDSPLHAQESFMEYLDVPPQGIADSEVHIAVVSDGPSKPLGGELLQQDPQLLEPERNYIQLDSRAEEQEIGPSVLEQDQDSQKAEHLFCSYPFKTAVQT